jgi:Fur family ferric uptake transcriptional regulator
MARLDDEERNALRIRFGQWLRDKRLPATRQRQLIAEIVFGSGAHLSAEEIGRHVHERGVAIGTATIYRTLDLLVTAGLVRAHDFGQGFRRFEPLGRDGHEHLVCMRCGRVVEFSSERLERMLPVIADEHAFRPLRHRVEIFGTCGACLERELGGLDR